MANDIINEKLDQAVSILAEQDLDCWLTFVRESALTPDPCLEMILGMPVTWQSAFIVTRSGERVAIVGRFDIQNVLDTGSYSKVISYDQSIRPALRETLDRISPRQIALNFSESDPAADGLSYGMYRYLREAIGTEYDGKLISAESFISALRGRKSNAEVERIRAAINTTEFLYRKIGDSLAPGQTEREIAEQMSEWRRNLGLKTAWDEADCPIVNAGPDSAAGHAAPGDYTVKRGELLHMDFGVQESGFCSDLQRMWYVPQEGETEPPDDVRRAWYACWAAIDAATTVLKPGVRGWEVDAAAREHLVSAGFPEYQHALGHHLGRACHDGATLLGPRWERYGDTPNGIVEEGNVFTLELGTFVPGRGYIGLEEDVRITANGLEWLSTPQREIWLTK
jgi:Xaa-Pro aminopeptidase